VICKNPNGLCDGKQFFTRRHRLAVFQTVGQHAQRERFDLGQGIVARFAVSHTARQIRDVGEPPATHFALNLDFQVHAKKLNQTTTAVEWEIAECA